MNGWQIAALAVQVLGLIVTAWGIRTTWVAHPTGQPFLAPAEAAWKATTTRVEQTARRVSGGQFTAP
ncbi:hypothetical protein [Cellulomonas sp. Root137]|uniref:hypothetical protein n=1 Tax=Cellulomonas sp. Root137 TaxID=1736459 RepID=UPI0012E3AB2C|nr:hypothetical protein [Cellulomonas sp. Root137]